MVLSLLCPVLLHGSSCVCGKLGSVSVLLEHFPESFHWLHCLQALKLDGDAYSQGINFITLSVTGGPSHTFMVGLIIMYSFEIHSSNTVCNVFGGGRGRVLKRLSQNLA